MTGKSIVIIALALMLLPAAAAAEPFAGKFAQLPRAVREHIASLERQCREITTTIYPTMTPEARILSDPITLSYRKAANVHSLSGPKTRDYIIDEAGFTCRDSTGRTHHIFSGATGNHGLSVYLADGRAWRTDFIIDWYIIPRPGKKTVLVLRHRCYQEKNEPCYGHYSYDGALRITRNSVEEREISNRRR